MSLPYDVSRCPGDGCLLKDTCERFTDKAVGGTWVTYFGMAPYNPEDNTCELRIPLEDT